MPFIDELEIEKRTRKYIIFSNLMFGVALELICLASNIRK